MDSHTLVQDSHGLLISLMGLSSTLARPPLRVQNTLGIFLKYFETYLSFDPKFLWLELA